jgi:uncharacterized protein YkwD
LRPRIHTRTVLHHSLAAIAVLVAVGDGRSTAQTAYTAPRATYVQPAAPRVYAPRGYTYTYPAARPVANGYTNQGYQSYYRAPAATTNTTAAPAATATYDQSWFLNWLNGVRAQYGLPAVGYDANLANWAASNSAEQARRGLGHFVMGPARRQNSAMGSAASIGAMWMNSPAHRAALLDPSIRWIGLAVYGSYWTFNAY